MAVAEIFNGSAHIADLGNLFLCSAARNSISDQLVPAKTPKNFVFGIPQNAVGTVQFIIHKFPRTAHIVIQKRRKKSLQGKQELREFFFITEPFSSNY